MYPKFNKFLLVPTIRSLIWIDTSSSLHVRSYTYTLYYRADKASISLRGRGLSTSRRGGGSRRKHARHRGDGHIILLRRAVLAMILASTALALQAGHTAAMAVRQVVGVTLVFLTGEDTFLPACVE